MKNFVMIGYGAMASYVADALRNDGFHLQAAIVRPGREDAARKALGTDVPLITATNQLHDLPDIAVDCAGHEGLRAHAGAFLRQGIPVVSASLGALADAPTYNDLMGAAQSGNARLILVSGALGGLDALSAARVGQLEAVSYTGTKKPGSWKGSPAEDRFDLDRISQPTELFAGTAGDAALAYPKNANVAAAVALAGIGFDKTQTRLIADPAAKGNTHTVTAKGAFGEFTFNIVGNSLETSPRTSALAAMAVVDRVKREFAPIAVM